MHRTALENFVNGTHANEAIDNTCEHRSYTTQHLYDVEVGSAYKTPIQAAYYQEQAK